MMIVLYLHHEMIVYEMRTETVQGYCDATLSIVSQLAMVAFEGYAMRDSPLRRMMMVMDD